MMRKHLGETLWGRNELAKKKLIFQFRVRFLT
jgi:hypothetical protein